jgi:hypothetical protein
MICYACGQWHCLFADNAKYPQHHMISWFNQPVQILHLADSVLPFYLSLTFLLLSMPPKNTAKKHAASGTAKRVSGPLGLLAALLVPASPRTGVELEVAQLEVHSQVSSFFMCLLMLTL